MLCTMSLDHNGEGDDDDDDDEGSEMVHYFPIQVQPAPSTKIQIACKGKTYRIPIYGIRNRQTGEEEVRRAQTPKTAIFFE